METTSSSWMENFDVAEPRGFEEEMERVEQGDAEDISEGGVDSAVVAENNDNEEQYNSGLPEEQESEQNHTGETEEPADVGGFDMSSGLGNAEEDVENENGEEEEEEGDRKMEEMETEEGDNDNSSSESVSTKEELESYLLLLERDQHQLNTLMVLKEREWDAVLKLKKLKEIKIARLKRRKEVDEVLKRGIIGGGFKAGHSLVDAEGTLETARKREVEARNTLRVLEKEVEELANEVFAEQEALEKAGMETGGQSVLDSQGGSEANEGAFVASNALKSLVSKSRFASSTGPGVPTNAKVIGEGRQGPKVDVSTLIADYRLKSQGFDADSRRRSTATPTFPQLNQSSGISFTDILTKIKTHYEKEKDLGASLIPAVTPNNVKTVPPATKAKGGGGNYNSPGPISLPTAKTPVVGTTLAKLLSSSSNGTSASRDESNHKSTTSNSGSEKSLSLATLLASSRSRDEVPKKKAETAAVPVCQGCQANKAQFVCAGCANQWYCSRECQVAAWDEHSEVCSG